jgi:hypothetical protein
MTPLHLDPGNMQRMQWGNCEFVNLYTFPGQLPALEYLCELVGLGHGEGFFNFQTAH